MGAMKAIVMQRQERPDVQEQLAIEDLLGLPIEPDYPDTQDFMTEPLEGTVFDPDMHIPF